MAERVITVEMNVDASGAAAGLEQINQEAVTTKELLEGIEDDIRNVSKATKDSQAAENFAKLNDIVEKNVLSLQELGTAADNYKNIALAAGKESPIGQEALKKAAQLEKQIDQTNQSVAKLAEGGRNLNTAMQLGTGVVAGYSAFLGVTELLGEENEDLQKTFVKLQAAQAALMGIKELSIALDKEGLLVTTAQATATKVLAAVTTAYNAVVGTSTGLMKAFKLALAGTGIGAIVIGIGLLIANFDALVGWVKDAVEWFGHFGETLTRVAEFLGFAEKGTADLMEAERKLREERKAAEKELTQQHFERLKQIDEERNAKIEAADETIEALKLEKDTLEAQGKSSFESTLAILEHEKLKVEAVLEANRQKIQSWVDYYTKLAEMRGQDEAEFIESMKSRGIDLEKLQNDANELIAEGERMVQYSENRITELKRTENEKRAQAAKEHNDKLLAEQDRYLQEFMERERLLTQLLIDGMEDSTDKELAALRFKHDQEREAIIEKYGQDTELLLALERKQQQELEDLFDSFAQRRLEKEKELDDQLLELDQMAQDAAATGETEAFDARIAAAQEKIDEIQGYLDTANQINDILNEIGDRRLKENQERRDAELAAMDKNRKQILAADNLTAQGRANIEKHFAMQEFNIKKQAAEAEDKINKRKFQRDKALRLAQIGIDTATAIVKAIAMFGPPPSPAGIAGIAVAGGIGVAQAAIVASQQFQGSAGSIQPPSFDVSPAATNGGSGAGSGSQAANAGGGGQNNTTTQTGPLVGEGGGEVKTKVELSMVEVNEAQNEMQMIDNISTL